MPVCFTQKLRGECVIKIKNEEGEDRNLSLGKVLYCPGMNMRLFSANSFCKVTENEMNFASGAIKITIAGYITKTTGKKSIRACLYLMQGGSHANKS